MEAVCAEKRGVGSVFDAAARRASRRAPFGDVFQRSFLGFGRKKRVKDKFNAIALNSFVESV